MHTNTHMMLKADWTSDMQQKIVLIVENRSIQIISPQAGSRSINTKLASRLTMITLMP